MSEWSSAMGRVVGLPHAAALVVVLVSAFWGLGGAISTLHANWTGSFTYSHGYLVLGMSLWLLWCDRYRLMSALGRPSLAGQALLALMCGAYVLADLLDITIGRVVLIPPLVLATAAGMAGFRLARRMAPGVAFLYFAVPVWDALIRPLQEITTAAVSAVLAFTPVRAFIEGNYVTTPHGAFEIAAGCSGIHFFIVGAAMATFYAMLWLKRASSSALLISVAVASAMAANWLRVLILILVGEYTAMEHYLIQEDHYVFGWVLFGVVMLPVFWFARRLELADARAGSQRRPAREPNAALSSAPTRVLMAGGVCALLLAVPALMQSDVPLPREPSRLPLHDVIVTPSLDWQPVPTHDGWAPDYKRPWAEFRSAYRGPQAVQVDVYAARYDRQQAGSKLIYFSNRLDEGWRHLSSSKQHLPFSGGTRTVNETELANGDNTRLIWEWYLIGGYVAHERSIAKLLEVPALLAGRRDAAVIAVSAGCATNCDIAREAMRGLLAGRIAELERATSGRTTNR